MRFGVRRRGASECERLRGRLRCGCTRWSLRADSGGYDMSQALTYVWLGQGLPATRAMMGSGFEDELIERIRAGDVAIGLYGRPIPKCVGWPGAWYWRRSGCRRAASR